MKTFKIALCVAVISLVVTGQVHAGETVISVKKLKLKFYPDGIMLEHSGGAECYRVSFIDAVLYDRKTEKLSISTSRGHIFHYQFPNDQAYHGLKILEKMAEKSFLGFHIKGDMREASWESHQGYNHKR
jgi:hypothetical protein